MNTTPTIGALAAALAKAQGSMRAASLDRVNPHFKSRYATLASIIDSARDSLAINGLSVVQGTSLVDGRLVVTTRLMHSSGEWIEDSISIKPMADTAQALGSAITYGRRYSYASMLGIVSDDDDDGEQATSKPKPAKPAQVARGASVSDEATQVISDAKQQAAKPTTEANIGKGIADDAKRIMSLVMQVRGVSSRGDVCAELSRLLSRTISGSSDLSDDNERKQLLAWLETVAADSNAEHRARTWDRTAQAYAEKNKGAQS
jgi:hypothetical protein